MLGSANLNVMVKAARAAARRLVRDFREVENLQVSVKGAGDFVSRADIAAEKTIRDMLTAERPNYGWLGEESEEVKGKDPTRRWIVDPLDGTTNFLHGQPHWAVSIALEHKGEIVAGVIFDAAKDELFVAEKGAGAFVNDHRIRVSGRKRMIESVFTTALPHSGDPTLPLTLRDLGRVLPAAAAVRSTGSAALDLAAVAAGRFDGYWQRRINAWDVAAGLILVREAGGFVEPLAGEDVFGSGTIVAGNGEVFGTLAETLRAAA